MAVVKRPIAMTIERMLDGALEKAYSLKVPRGRERNWVVSERIRREGISQMMKKR